MRLEIYDVLGRRVATLADGQHAAGSYSVTWNAPSVPDGVYFYQLDSPLYSDVRKMVVIR